jgi:hypothetical protein
MTIARYAMALALLCAPATLQAQDTKPTTQPSSRPSATVAKTDGYPLNTCIVSGKALGDKQKVVEAKGHSIKVCSGTCAKKVAADPDPYIKKLDAAIIEQQMANYPLDTCLISKRKLGSMGRGRNLVVDGQLVRLCCGGCVKKVKTTLKGYVLGEIRKAAYAKQIAGHKDGKGMTCVVSNKPADRKGSAQMIMHGNTLVAVCCKTCLKKFKADPNKYMAKMAAAKKEANEKSHEGDHDEHGKKGDHSGEKEHGKGHDADKGEHKK